jgi:hypothetical protein
MRRLFLTAALAALVIACSPHAPKTEAPPEPPALPACNELTPNLSRMIFVEQPTEVATLANELRGGAVAPGTYDLMRAVRFEQATGWQGGRAVVLDVAENNAGVVTFNWAGAAGATEVDRWTATFSDTQPQARISYTCGRMGDVDATFAADADKLQLRIPDGANGSLQLDFQRRS